MRFFDENNNKTIGKGDVFFYKEINYLERYSRHKEYSDAMRSCPDGLEAVLNSSSGSESIMKYLNQMGSIELMKGCVSKEDKGYLFNIL